MKRLFLTLAVLALTLGVAPVTQAQERIPVEKVEQSLKEDGKYALFVHTTNQFKAAMITAEQLQAMDKKISLQVVMAGPVLKDLVEEEGLKNLAVKMIELDVSLVACGIALKEMDIAPESLPEEVQVTDNAAIYLWGLQELGYKTL